MRALEATKDRQWSRDQRAWKHEGLGATDGAQSLVRFYFDEYLDLVKTRIEGFKGNKGFRGSQRVILSMDTDKLTYLILYAGMCAVGLDDPRVTAVMRVLGRALEDQAYGDAFIAHDKDKAKKLETTVKAKHASYVQRRAAIRAYAKHASFVWTDWSDQDRLKAGRTIIEMLVEGPLFAIDDDQMLTITEPARMILDILMQELVLKRLISLPQTGPVLRWSGLKLHIEGLPYHLIRSFQKPVKRHVQEAIDAGEMQKPLDALNHAQATLWRINDRIYDLVRTCYEQGLVVSGLPTKRDLPIPEKPKTWEKMSPQERQAWKKKASSVRIVNRGLIGERVVLARDLAEAEVLNGSPFWTPMNFDYRGRVYGMSLFNYQRADHVRAMFEFEEGQIVNDEGLYWLKVHLANTGDFDKMSKRPFDERVAWVDNHQEGLLAVAADPLATHAFWSQADKPFMFVAACLALQDALRGKPVHIPTSFDGSCSGLGHLCAMARSEEGRLVNLLPISEPQDIYQTVADRVKTKVEKDITSKETLVFKNKDGEIARTVRIADIARMTLAYGVTRSLVKRNVMTYSYSSKRSGMQDQLMEDTMRPLALKVLSGEIDKHPFGEDGGYAAARYLSGLTYSSITETVSKPAEVMDFLRRIAKVMSAENKPVTWSTPTGFPVMLRYPKMEIKQLSVFLHNKELRIQPKTATPTDELDGYRAANAISPSFVHSLDASHLQMVVLAARDAGISSVALVHDSFGCLPNDAPKFRSIILDTFVRMYQDNDVLQQILDRAYEAMDALGYKLPTRPHDGQLDIEEVRNAIYAFA